MTRILFVGSSTRGAQSYSTRIATALVERLQTQEPDAIVTVRDLARDPVPHIDEPFVNALATPPGQRTPPQRAATAEQAVSAALDAVTLSVTRLAA